MINKTKSAVLFSKNTKAIRKREVCDTLQVNKETMNERYLGLPVHVGAIKRSTFPYLKDRIWQHIPRVEGEVPLMDREGSVNKSHVAGHPKIRNGLFDLLTKSLCDQISKMVGRFWWNAQEGKQQIHWLSRNVLQNLEGKILCRYINS